MNIIRRRDPMESLGMGRLIRDFFDDPFFADLAPPEGQAALLPVDIAERDDELIVRASVPGFAPDDLDVQIQNGLLTISGEHTEEHEEQDERFHRRERRFGSVSRTVPLPADVSEDQCRAELRDGVLTLHLPKRTEARARRIQISNGGSEEGAGKGRQAGGRQGQSQGQARGQSQGQTGAKGSDQQQGKGRS